MNHDSVPKRASASADAKYERCIIVCAYLPEGASPDQGYRMRDALNDLDTDGWWFLNPSTFIVAFRDSKLARKRADACRTALSRLSEAIASLSQLSVGAAEGEMLCTVNESGEIDAPPLGEVVSLAFREARKYAP
jgi:hypothetical protein